MNKSSQAKAKWLSANTERIVLQVRKGIKSRIQSAADSAGQSVTAYILQAVESRISEEASEKEPS